MPHGRNMPLDLRDVGPDYTGPLRLNDIVLIPEQEEKLRIKVDQEKGRDTVELRPGRLVKQNRRPNLPLIKTWPPEVEPDKTEYYDWEMIPKRNSDVDKTGITFKRRSEEYITAHKKYLN